MTNTLLLTIKELHKLLTCDAEAGTLTWKARDDTGLRGNQLRSVRTFNATFAGKAALNSISGCGYRNGRVMNTTFQQHRVIWAMHYGAWPVNQIDHINGDRADNRIENLRDVTNLENTRNQNMRKTNTSGCMGVYWCNTNKKWKARINTGEKRISLGYHRRKRDAIAARQSAEVKYGFHENHGKR